jgi:hypothetical protein
MTCPTLIARTRTEDSAFVIPVSSNEGSWLTFGESLVEAHAEMEQGRTRADATGEERDSAGFAAKGLELAVAAWNEATADHRGSDAIWKHYTRLVEMEINGGWCAPVEAGLTLALTIMGSAQGKPVLTIAR